ncbi:MAG TPA: IS4 family transposase [Myxococcus sp.]|nr:IS4 family transposase [Myxococcus sp.]
MTHSIACQAWASREFEKTETGDARRTARVVKMAAQAAARPGGKLTQVFSEPAERQAAYKLLEKGHVQQQALARAAAAAAWKRVRGEKLALVAVDGCTLTLPAAQVGDGKGYGPVGTAGVKASGVEATNAVLVSLKGSVVQGVVGQALWARPQQPCKLTESAKRARPLEEKETRWWLQVLQSATEGWRASGVKTRPWYQLDAGADAREVLEWAAWVDGPYVTVRCAQNRRLEWPQDELLWPTLEGLESKGLMRLRVPASAKRQGRKALLQLRFSPVVVRLRNASSGQVLPVELFAVHALEAGTCPKGEEPIEWMLLTNRPVHGLKGARQVLRAYACRWRVEEVHRTWKSGCRVEDSGLHYEPFSAWATLLFCVAVRIERLKRLARQAPELPASSEFTPEELAALLLLKRKSHLYPKGGSPTLADAVLWVAELGGYTGKSSGGPPGSITLKRGLDRLAPAAEVLRFQAELKK